MPSFSNESMCTCPVLPLTLLLLTKSVSDDDDDDYSFRRKSISVMKNELDKFYDLPIHM